MSQHNKLPITLYSHDNQSTIDGLIVPPKLNRELLGIFPKLPFKSGDVVMATYPKSGTTWTNEIIWQIFNDGVVEKTSVHTRIPYLEIRPLVMNATADDIIKLVETHPSRIFKTHLPIGFLPVDNTTRDIPKYVCTMRNPKDIAVSFFHFYHGIYHIDFEGTWDEFFEMYIKGQVLYGSWFDHVLGWWQRRDDPNILFVKYEDMKKNLPATVEQLAKFVGKDLTPEMIKKIAQQTTFDAMKADQEQHVLHFYKETEKFFRKGQVGDWKNYFTEEQNRRIDELIAEKLVGTGLEFDYE